MRGFGFAIDDVREIAEEFGLRVEGEDLAGSSRDSYGGSRTRCDFTLKLDPVKRKEDGTLPYQRISMMLPSRYSKGVGRRIAAVCWHGHRDVLRALFSRFPQARVKSALADYKGLEGFEESYRATFGQSNAYNLSYGQACVCKEVHDV